MGYWFRGRHELLLVGRRGDFPCPPPKDRVPSVINAPRGDHSEKPDAVHEILESYYPELFEDRTVRTQDPGRMGGGWQ